MISISVFLSLLYTKSVVNRNKLKLSYLSYGMLYFFDCYNY